MPSAVVKLGPFNGGLNQTSDASAIAENELSECINLIVDLDGSLVCRPPITEVKTQLNPIYSYTVGDIYGRILIIGSALIGGTPYLILSTPGGVAVAKVISNTNGFEVFEYHVISTTLRSDCAIQLHNVVFILARPDSPSDSIIWDGSTIATNVSPKGSSALFFKGRVWVVPGAFQTSHPESSQLRFTDPVALATPVTLTWNPVNLIPVGQGDGQNLIDLLVVGDNLMLFKNNSTYAFMYDVSPNEGIVRKINNNIGVSAQFCVLTHENEAYTYHEGNVYQISNYNFIETSVKVPFKHPTIIDPARREQVTLSLLEDLIILRYFNRMYVLNLATKTWSEWKSNDALLNTLSRITKLETNQVLGGPESYYGGSYLTSSKMLMRIKPEATSVDKEAIVEADALTLVPIECSMVTKIFDFSLPHVFKRLLWWGIDLISDGHVIAKATPIRQTEPVTWDDLTEYTWDQLNTWDLLLEGVTSVETDVDDPYVIRRKFIKVLKSLRFRQISFAVKFYSDGKTSLQQTLGPARLFSLSAIVGNKQTVVKQVE